MKSKEHFNSSPCYCINLRRAANAITEYYDKTLKPSGLTINQYSLLSHIKWLDLCSVSELAEKMRLERTTLVRNLKPLITSGLVEDLSLPRQRTRQLRVTELGLERLNTAQPLWKQAQAGIKSYIGEETLSSLKGTLYSLENI